METLAFFGCPEESLEYTPNILLHLLVCWFGSVKVERGQSEQSMSRTDAAGAPTQPNNKSNSAPKIERRTYALIAGRSLALPVLKLFNFAQLGGYLFPRH